MNDIFEFFINSLQSLTVTHFLIRSFGTRRHKAKPLAEYIVCFAVTLVYLEIVSRITFFESFGIFTYLIISVIFCIVLLDGSVLEKVFYNFIMIGVIVFSSVFGGGIVGLFTDRGYLQIVLSDSWDRYIAAIVAQIIMCLLFGLILKLREILRNNDSIYINILSVVPVLSVVICCLLVVRDSQTGKHQIWCTLLSVAGIFVMNVISLALLAIEHKTYTEAMHKTIRLKAYEQREKDVEDIKAMRVENDKVKHEMKRVLTLLSELINNGEYQKASEFLQTFTDSRRITQENSIYSDHVVLNYLLNRRIEQCNACGIDIKCFVSGSISGIDDVDLYILLENLLDNAMEASLSASHKEIDFMIYSDDEWITIEISNTTKGNVLEENPKLHTTKRDASLHGYGLQNIRDVVSRYDGRIEYQTRAEEYLFCRVELKKGID